MMLIYSTGYLDQAHIPTTISCGSYTYPVHKAIVASMFERFMSKLQRQDNVRSHVQILANSKK
jgi:hypothetical protein